MPRDGAAALERRAAGVGEKHTFTAKQPELPALDRPEVEQASRAVVLVVAMNHSSFHSLD